MLKQSMVDQFLAQRTIALAGVSRGGKKFGNIVFKELIKQTYDLLLIHPEASDINGHTCFSSVSDLPDKVTGLVLVVPPEQTEKIVKLLPLTKIRNVWMQQGSESLEAIEFCQDNDINLIHGECILMFAQARGFHKFHRWVWGLMGKLPKE